MIYAEARDAMTRPLVTVAKVPGEDELTWVETDTEEDIRTDLSHEMNAAMMATQPELTIAPWPLPVPRQAPVDLTMRYQWLAFHLHEYDQAHEAWAPVPGGTATIRSTYDRLDRDQVAMTKMRSPHEVRALKSDPENWIRLPFVNEAAGTDMKDPIAMIWNGLQNARFTLELPDNDVFEPFDLTHPERYSFVGDGGKAIESGQAWGAFGDRARVVLYLRPRRWRWVVTVLAHFEFVTWFEEVPNDEMFVCAFFRRPPFYPYRHNIAVSAQPDQYNTPDYFGNLRSYDQGISSAWDLSWHSIELRRQILDQQWFSMCEAYVFLGNEPPDIAIQAYPPRMGEIVVGIGFVDEATGRESRAWAVQATDASAIYPQRTVVQVITYWDA
jgi:hypothetical protein